MEGMSKTEDMLESMEGRAEKKCTGVIRKAVFTLVGILVATKEGCNGWATEEAGGKVVWDHDRGCLIVKVVSRGKVVAGGV